MTTQPDARLTTPSVIALAQALHDDDRAPDMPQALAAARYVLAVHARELADVLRAAKGQHGSGSYDYETGPGMAHAAEQLDEYAHRLDTTGA